MLASGTCILQKDSSTSAPSLTGANSLAGASEPGISPTHLHTLRGFFPNQLMPEVHDIVLKTCDYLLHQSIKYYVRKYNEFGRESCFFESSVE